jgi:hypothetical protein
MAAPRLLSVVQGARRGQLLRRLLLFRVRAGGGAGGAGEAAVEPRDVALRRDLQRRLELRHLRPEPISSFSSNLQRRLQLRDPRALQRGGLLPPRALGGPAHRRRLVLICPRAVGSSRRQFIRISFVFHSYFIREY